MEQVNQFKQAWLGHAYTYTKEYRTIYAGQLVSLLRELPPPLGVGAEGSFYDCQILAKKVLFPIQYIIASLSIVSPCLAKLIKVLNLYELPKITLTFKT